ncbi:hypothetical protein M8J77_018377 [Diaphorina citri]|nr:hypothetical protein M8J77_018377 [Diaphorina citri]
MMNYESLMGRSDFKESSVRQAFVRKVYSILMVQLAITTAIISLFLFNPDLKMFVVSNMGFFWFMNLLAFVLLMAMACFQDLRRSYPLNYVFLMLFTIVQGITLGSVTVVFDAEQILYAVAITSLICLAITIFSFQTSVDFTVWGGFLCIAALVMFLFSLVVIFFPSKTLVFLMGCAGAVLFSLYLLYDTQLMMGGQHKYALSPEEYIFAALNLYVDIIQIFLSILQIMSTQE